MRLVVGHTIGVLKYQGKTTIPSLKGRVTWVLGLTFDHPYPSTIILHPLAMRLSGRSSSDGLWRLVGRFSF